MLRRLLRRLLREEQGQDLVEYSLLIAFVCLAAIGIMNTTGSSVAPIWNSADHTLQSAATTASTSPAVPSGGSGGGTTGGSTTGGGKHEGDHHRH